MIMSYESITEYDRKNKREGLRMERRTELYTSIFRDLSAILKILLPTKKADIVGQHLKSLMYSVIELKTGKRPGKF